jgi:hypothetical protein
VKYHTTHKISSALQDLPSTPSATATLLCHRCGAVAQPVLTESYQACGGRLSEATAHALIDHFILIESELAQIRRLLLEEVGL